MTFVVMQVKWSVTLTDRLGPEILTVLERKGQVLHCVRLHVKVPGWSLNLNVAKRPIVTYFGDFGYLNSSCIRKNIVLMF